MVATRSCCGFDPCVGLVCDSRMLVRGLGILVHVRCMFVKPLTAGVVKKRIENLLHFNSVEKRFFKTYCSPLTKNFSVT